MERKCWGMATISSVRQQDHIPSLLFLKCDWAQVPAVKQAVSASKMCLFHLGKSIYQYGSFLEEHPFPPRVTTTRATLTLL